MLRTASPQATWANPCGTEVVKTQDGIPDPVQPESELQAIRLERTDRTQVESFRKVGFQKSAVL